MIVSIVEKASEHEGKQKLLVRGSTIEIATELTNIVKEIMKRGFPEELIINSVLEAVEENPKSTRVTVSRPGR